MVPIVPNGTNVKVEWYQRNYSERSHHHPIYRTHTPTCDVTQTSI